MRITARDLRDRPAVWWTLTACAVAAQVGDIVTTLAVMRAGGGEGNPLAAFLMREGGWLLWVGCKLALATVILVVGVAFALTPHARHSLTARVALVALVASALLVLVSWLVLVNNLADWLILAHALPWR